MNTNFYSLWYNPTGNRTPVYRFSSRRSIHSTTDRFFYKSRHYVPLSTLRIVYYCMFHSHIQYSLLNWGKAAKSHFHKLSILQNKILRACLFCPRRYETNLLYSRFRVLKLDDMIKMEFAKFIFKYSNNMLPNSFNNYFIKLKNIHNYNTRQKSRNEYFQTSFRY